METKFRNKNYLIIMGSVLTGLLLGWLIFSGGNETTETAHTASEHTEETIWTCSMHPQIRRNEPGDCPICGMELIPVQDDMAQGNPQAVQLSEYAMKLANVQTMEVGSNASTNEIRLNGKVAVDERKVYAQSTHIPGRIERLFVSFTGEEVNRGQALARIYSPAMVTAQEELLQAYAIRESNPRLFEAAKEKLRNWRIGENQINRILESGQASEQFTITADVNGIVTKKLVELGDYVERGMPIYEIADLSQVWVLFDIYENDMSWIEEGSTVEFTVASIPGKTFEGTVDFVDPLLNAQTRVSTARVVVDNSDGRLKPGMFVSGIIQNPVGRTSSELTVPKSAVLWTGERSVVYIKKNSVGEREFALREVVLGPALGDSYIIVDGLEAGEEVVVNGAFSVDAAAQLAGKPSMMDPKKEIKKSDSFITVVISEKEKQQFEPILSNYLEFKDALVGDDFSSAKKFSSKMDTQIKDIDKSQFNNEVAKIWASFQEELLKSTKAMSSAKNIQEMRNNFDELSETLIGMVNTFQLTNRELYVLHCPMVNSSKGAFWLSASSEVKNPYYGSAMLSCGELKSALK